MKNSNIRVTSNIYPVNTQSWTFFEGEFIPLESNSAYFQEVSDHKALRAACESCSCTCGSCMQEGNLSEKPWGRVRVNGLLVDICKCSRTSCERFYRECRPNLETPNGNQ